MTMLKALGLAIVLIIPMNVAALDVGELAKDFSLPTTAGAKFSLASHRGKIIYLDFWASWCAPCKLSFPWMNSLKTKFPTDKLAVVAINLDKNEGAVSTFLQQNSAEFDVLLDPAADTAKSFALKGMPTSFLIGVEGEIKSVHVGFKESTKQKVEDEIARLLGTIK